MWGSSRASRASWFSVGAAVSGDCKQCTGKSGGANNLDLDTVLAQLQGRFQARIALWREHPRVQGLRDESLYRLCRLVLRSAQWQAEGRVTEEACMRLADWMEALLRRESYLAMLLERPKVHERLLRMLGAARWPARYLLTHPGVIDELASRELLDERFDAQAFEGDLERRLLALEGTGEEDDESVLNLLRRAHHAEVFRTLTRDVEGRLTVEQVADDLSALAESVLRMTTRWCWAHRATSSSPGSEMAGIPASVTRAQFSPATIGLQAATNGDIEDKQPRHQQAGKHPSQP